MSALVPYYSGFRDGINHGGQALFTTQRNRYLFPVSRRYVNTLPCRVVYHYPTTGKNHDKKYGKNTVCTEAPGSYLYIR